VIDAAARTRLHRARVARLATLRADDRRPHIVPVCFALVDDDTVVSAVDHKPKRTDGLVRLANVRASPAVSLLVDHYEDDWSQLWWLRADGTGRVVDGGRQHAAGIDALVAKYAQYRERRPSGAVVVIDVTSWTGWDARS
jgi:PPOX class probable F420-dependent enzyme